MVSSSFQGKWQDRASKKGIFWDLTAGLVKDRIKRRGRLVVLLPWVGGEQSPLNPALPTPSPSTLGGPEGTWSSPVPR